MSPTFFLCYNDDGRRGDFIMKIDPKKNYKIPLYALGVASLVGTSLLCTSCGPLIAGEMSPPPTEETSEVIESEITEEETN